MEKFIRFGKTELLISAFAGMSKVEFMLKYKGKVDFDIHNAWHQLQKELNKRGLTDNPKYMVNKGVDTNVNEEVKEEVKPEIKNEEAVKPTKRTKKSKRGKGDENIGEG